MKRIRVFIIMILALICALSIVLTACNNSSDGGKKNDEHVHEWAENVSAEYLEHEADCLSPATYYKSCSICGARSEETFEFGKPNNRHTFADNWSTDSKNHWKDATCGHSVTEDMAAHTFAEVVKDEFKLFDGNCGTPAIYIKSCSVCGYHKDTQHLDELVETDIFMSGEPTGNHNFIKKESDNYLKSEATCAAPKTYYKSCSVCGERSSETFTVGNALPHDFGARYHDEEYLKSPATCTSPAIYYESCWKCGAAAVDDNRTFEYGEKLEHDFSDGKNCSRCGALPYDFVMKLGEDGEHYVVDGINYCYADEIIIPSTYKGKPVTEIGSRLYLYHPQTVTIPESITKINGPIIFSESMTVNWNSAAFPTISDSARLMKVETLNLGPNVKTLPPVFQGIKRVTAVALEETADAAFYYCPNLESAELGNNLIKIGAVAFRGCKKLVNFSFGNNLKEIGNDAFCECSSLTNITIPKTVTLVGEYAFSDCTGLVDVVFEYEQTSTPHLTISHGAFYNCSGISTLTLGKTIESIGSSAFYNCSSLKTVTMPESLRQISENAFNTVKELTTIYWNATNCKTTRGLLPVFNGCPKVARLIIDDNVKAIPDRAFFGLGGIKSVTIPANVTSIGESAFKYCTALFDVDIKANLTIIPSGAFSNCSSLFKITLPKSVTTIGSYAFGESGLTECIIHENVTSISNNAFQGSNLEFVIWNAVNYKGDDDHSIFFSDMNTITRATIGANVINIPFKLFFNCSSLKTVEIGANVKSIGEYAFYNTSLKTVKLGANVKSIGKYAFYGATLTSLEIGDNVEEIGVGAFGNTYLKEISLPATLKTVDRSAFDISTLETVNFAGSKQEWRNATAAFPHGWGPARRCKVVCSDGTINA